jgi:hypothetical protein
MSTETNKIKAFIVRPAVDRHQIWLDVAVAMIGPFTRQWMIEVSLRQGLSAASMSTMSIRRPSSFLPCRPDFSRR